MTTLASLLYASSVWWVYTWAKDRDRIDKLLNRLRLSGYLPMGDPSFKELAKKQTSKTISANPNHVLSKHLPNLKAAGYNLRPKAHGYAQPIKDDLNFMSRVLCSELNQPKWPLS